MFEMNFLFVDMDGRKLKVRINKRIRVVVDKIFDDPRYLIILIKSER